MVKKLIGIEPETHKRIMLYKLQNDLKSVDHAIIDLLDKVRKDE